MSPDLRRKYIIKNASTVALGTIRYSDIIKNCVRFADETQEQGKNHGGSFREGFYQKIVQPLKDKEDQLLLQQKEGKRWMGNVKDRPCKRGTGDTQMRGE